MNIEKIAYTHNGRAHMDDVLCTAWLVTNGYTVRRVPDVPEAALDDPHTIVFDIGDRYEPDRNNFDHHQPGGPDACSFSLLMQYLVEDMTPSVAQLLRQISLIDTRGAFGAFYAMNPSLLQLFKDPVKLPMAVGDNLLIELLSSTERVYPNDPFWTAIGVTLAGILAKATASDRTARELFMERTHGLGHSSLLIDARGEDISPQDIRRIVKRDFDEEVAVVVTTSLRNPEEATLTRTVSGGYDFNRIRDRDEVSFVHKNGFLAVIAHNTPIEDILSLTRESRVTGDPLVP
jgi:hypothetical protein